MKSKLLAGIMLICVPFFCSAQGKMKDKEYKGKMKMKGDPQWASSHHYTGGKDVYFPDYYTFYDPQAGYVYWNSGKWETSATLPAFLSTVDLNNARVELIQENVITQPQKEYLIYKKRYPARKVEITVPVPDEE
jgi:hypothetical protein